MPTRLTIAALLTVLAGASPALAASRAPTPTPTVRPSVSPPKATVQPRVNIPSTSQHIVNQLQTGEAAKKKDKKGKKDKGEQVDYMKIELKDAIITSY